MKMSSWYLCWIIASFLVAGPVVGQAGVPAQVPVFSDTVDVRLIHLEVVVTEKGQRVTGLGPEDFRLLVDGNEVPIEYFTAVEDGAARQARPGASSSATIPVPQIGQNTEVPTRYLVFVDDFFTIPAYRNRVLDKLADQLDLLGPEDQMAIVAFDGRRLTLLSTWTRSLAHLRTALAQAEERPAFGLQRLSEQRRFSTHQRYRTPGSSFSGIGFGGSGFSSAPLGADVLHRSTELRYQVDRVVAAATSALRGFAMPPGRKVMLLLAGGWPASVESWVAGSAEAGRLYAGTKSRRSFAPLIATANRLGYTLYPVDVPGAQRRGRSAEYGGLGEAVSAAERGSERELNAEQALFYLAERTGGQAFLDGASLTALERTVDDTRSYYWLGFTPDWRLDDRRHRVNVEVLRPGVKVRARDSFSDLSRQSETTMQVESAQLFDAPLPGGELVARLGKPKGSGPGKVLLPIELEIPMDRVTMLPISGGHGARLELRVAVINEDGERSDIPVIPVELSGQKLPAPGQIAHYETELKLRRQRQELLLTVSDPLSGFFLAKRFDFRP